MVNGVRPRHSLGDPGVVLGRPPGPALFLRVLDHGPELVAPKRDLVLSQALLRKQDRALGGELDDKGRGNRRRQSAQAKEADQKEVQELLIFR